MRDNFDYQKIIILNIQLTKILEYEFEVIRYINFLNYCIRRRTNENTIAIAVTFTS